MSTVVRHPRQAAAIASLTLSATLLLTACGGSEGAASSPSEADSATQAEQAESPRGEGPAEIADGTYVAVNLPSQGQNERAVLLVLGGEDVTHTYSDCYYGVSTKTGERSGLDIVWDDGGSSTEFPTEIKPLNSGKHEFELQGVGTIPYASEFSPIDAPGVAEDLAEFNQRCDEPLPGV